jgi:hypothetical protein
MSDVAETDFISGICKSVRRPALTPIEQGIMPVPF